MNLFNLKFPKEIPVNKDRIYLDDVPVESLIYNNSVTYRPTPADIPMLWANGFPLTESMGKALTTILVNKISIAIDMDREDEAESLLIAAFEKAEVDGIESLNLLIVLINLFEKKDPVKRMKYYTEAMKLIFHLWDKLDNKTMNAWQNLCRKESLQVTPPFRKMVVEVNPNSLRAKALEKLEKNEFAEAEDIYQQLINRDFELPGTLCHLTRVQLLLHKEKEAEKSINRAWSLRKKALRYVLPRIIFFKILFSMLDHKNPAVWISRLKAALNDDQAFMDWIIHPTLIEYKSKIRYEDFQFLTALAEALQNKDKREELVQFDKWSKQRIFPILL
jgi:tetratricopeptide (TPR) repeat protein